MVSTKFRCMSILLEPFYYYSCTFFCENVRDSFFLMCCTHGPFNEWVCFAPSIFQLWQICIRQMVYILNAAKKRKELISGYFFFVRKMWLIFIYSGAVDDGCFHLCFVYRVHIFRNIKHYCMYGEKNMFGVYTVTINGTLVSFIQLVYR